jgi:hypothetical protein
MNQRRFAANTMLEASLISALLGNASTSSQMVLAATSTSVLLRYSSADLEFPVILLTHSVRAPGEMPSA